MSLWENLKKGLNITRTAIARNLKGLFVDIKEWTPDDYERLEAALIQADLGVKYTTKLMEEVKTRYEQGSIKTASDILKIAREDIIRIMSIDQSPIQLNPQGPTVIILVGVNGSGKTTTAGKLGWFFRQEKKSVLLAACDTFRAAAIDQLKIWSEKVQADFVAGKPGADPAAVAFDACKAAIARKIDIILIDTAGRQHTKQNLMNELTKIHRTVGKAIPGAPHETWLVIDGSCGSNGLIQAQEFNRAIPLTGIIVTKLDGTSKGGIVVAIHEELHHPVRFVGVGEKPELLQPFNPYDYAHAMFPDHLLD